MKFTKKALPLGQQILKLQGRGLIFDDLVDAEHFLNLIGYYRLSAYALPFQQNGLPKKPFKSGTKFSDILELYQFDRELRLLAMDALERIEVAIRTVIVNEMSMRHGPHWFMDGKHFNAASHKFRHHEFLDRLDKEFTIPQGGKVPVKFHREVFINHYFSKYTDPYLPPSWMVAETITLGTWSLIFEHLRVPRERQAIATVFGLDEQILGKWLHALTYLRNICAHHSRLWNRQAVIKMTIARKHQAFLKVTDRFYAFAVALYDLLQTISPGNRWQHRLAELMQRHPKVPLLPMGFPVDWHRQPFWNLCEPDYDI